MVGVDASVFPPVKDNGHVIAELRKELAAKIGARNQWPFVLVASHDTASAVAAISGRPGTAFVSSGTWSLVGVELECANRHKRRVGCRLHQRGGIRCDDALHA